MFASCPQINEISDFRGQGWGVGGGGGSDPLNLRFWWFAEIYLSQDPWGSRDANVLQ